MKKQIAALIVVGVVSFSGLALAADATPAAPVAAPAPAAPVAAPMEKHMDMKATEMKAVEATLVKVDGEFYILKGKDGKEFKGHFNDKTKKVGSIKPGSMVVVSIDDKGHTTEIKEHKAH